jgi:hypothetical protein
MLGCLLVCWDSCWGGWMDGNFIINIVHVHSLTIRKKCIYVFPGKKIQITTRKKCISAIPEKNTNNDWKKVIFANDWKWKKKRLERNLWHFISLFLGPNCLFSVLFLI